MHGLIRGRPSLSDLFPFGGSRSSDRNPFPGRHILLAIMYDRTHINGETKIFGLEICKQNYKPFDRDENKQVLLENMP